MYQGYTNWETWNWELHINNDEAAYELKLETFKRCLRKMRWPTVDDLINIENMYQISRMYDTTNLDTNKVNWAELAGCWEDDMREWIDYEYDAEERTEIYQYMGE